MIYLCTYMHCTIYIAHIPTTYVPTFIYVYIIEIRNRIDRCEKQQTFIFI